jgi:hypothetical protein
MMAIGQLSSTAAKPPWKLWSNHRNRRCLAWPGCWCMPASSAARPPKTWQVGQGAAHQLHRRVIASGAVSPFDLAHTLSAALALPLLDLNAVDLRAPARNVVDPKLAVQYQLVVLGRAATACSSAAPTPPTRRRSSASSSPPSCRPSG